MTLAEREYTHERSRTLKKAFAGAAIILLGFVLAGCANSLDDGPPIPLPKVDMDRMYGGWYIVATMRNGFEKGMAGPYDVYSKRPDGDITEDFYVRWGGFDAPISHYSVHDWVRPGTGNAHWRVQIIWPINLPFLVLYTDPEYRYVMFGEQNRKLGWIYSRTPNIPDDDYRSLIARFQALGYDPGAFVKIVQTPNQVGQPGFWNDGISND